MASKRSDREIVIALAQRIGGSDIAGRYNRAGNVIHISLSSCNLPHFPLEVLQLQHLQRLFLHQNQLHEPPAVISELKGLQLLGLSHNQLHELPPEIRRSLVKQITSLFLVLCWLLNASCAPTPLSRQMPHPTQLASPIARRTPQQLQLTSSAWEPLSLPATTTALLSSTVSPDNPSTIYACTSTSRTPGVASSIALWQTRDAGQHWSSLPMPKATGTACSISLAPSLHQRVAVLITDWCSDQPSCPHNTLYFSTDRGTTWQQLSLATTVPHGATITQNAISVADRHLYVWYAYGVRQDTLQHSLLARSDDDGLTWSRIDSSIEPHGFFLPPQIGQDELLVLSTRTLPPAAPAETLLWTSHDAGSSWRRVGTIPPPADNFLLFSQPPGRAFPAPPIPLYALGAEQLPSNLYELKVLQSTNGQHWSLLPPLPVRGTSVEHPGLLQALAVTGDGDLLAFGPDPKSGLPSSLKTLSDPMPAVWLWIWNPRASTWQVLSSPLTHPAYEGCGLCWSAQLSTGSDQGSYLYVRHWEVWPPPFMNSFYRVRLPSLPAAENSREKERALSSLLNRPEQWADSHSVQTSHEHPGS